MTRRFLPSPCLPLSLSPCHPLSPSPCLLVSKLTEWLWNRAVERRVADISALVLSPEGQVLHLTSHLAKHGWGRLLWFYDIAQVLRFYEDELDWDLIIAKAREFEILKALQVTMAKTVELLTLPVPPGVLERVESARGSLREKIAFTLLTARDKHAAILLSVISKDSLLRKVRFLAAVAFPSAEYMAERYQLSDRRELPLYYTYRLGSWFTLLLRSLFSVLSQALVKGAEGQGGRGTCVGQEGRIEV